jgi:cytochrome c oxidase subunit 2
MNTTSNVFLNTLSFIDFVTPKTQFAKLLIEFHHNIFVILFFIGGALVYIMLTTIVIYSTKMHKVNRNFSSFNYFKHQGMVLEVIWTIMPAVILFIIAIPSFVLLYSTAVFVDPEFTFKAIGHQWYWKYEVSAFSGSNKFVKDAYLIDTNNAKSVPRAMFTTFDPIVPMNTNVRCLVTSADVLHSWAVPALGVKIDACPGRINDVTFNVNFYGLAVGACSEICGINHGFMPTSVFVKPIYQLFGSI